MHRSRISPARKRQIVDLIKATLNTPTVVLTDRRLTYCSPAGVHQRGIPLRIPHANRIILKCEHLSAHSPTVRARRQTFDIAARLHRGESLSDE